MDSHWPEYKDTYGKSSDSTTVRLHVYKNLANKLDLHKVARSSEKMRMNMNKDVITFAFGSTEAPVLAAYSTCITVLPCIHNWILLCFSKRNVRSAMSDSGTCGYDFVT